MTNTKRARHAYLTPESHDQWHNFAGGHGVSVSALLEAFSTRFNPDSHTTTGNGFEELVRDTRMIDASRRRRK